MLFYFSLKILFIFHRWIFYSVVQVLMTEKFSVIILKALGSCKYFFMALCLTYPKRKIERIFRQWKWCLKSKQFVSVKSYITLWQIHRYCLNTMVAVNIIWCIFINKQFTCVYHCMCLVKVVFGKRHDNKSV